MQNLKKSRRKVKKTDPNERMNAIKWSGSKRSQAAEIIKYFPKEIDTYYEPFCGGASVFEKLKKSDIKVNEYVLSDVNEDLIDLYQTIKNNPKELCEHYERLWNELNQHGDSFEETELKKRYFEKVRKRFNEEKNPADFLFIMRTTTNGMPRYNKKGEFNNSFHVTRNGMMPNKLKKIIYEWNELLNGVEVRCCSYTEIIPKESDFVYLDPPYANTKGMYYGTIDYEELWEYLNGLECGWALSFDGKSDKDNTYNVPKIYDRHLYLKSGDSSFRRVIGKNRAMVWESLYIWPRKNG